MRISTMMRAALLAGAAIALSASSPAPDPDTLVDADFRVISENGIDYGCELGADVERAGVPAGSRDRISFSLTVLRVTPDRTARGLKLGYVAPGADEETAPDAVFLVTDGGDNRAEINGTKLSDTTGYRLTSYRGGDQTLAAFDTLAATGKLRIGVVTAGAPARVWTFDLSGRKDVRADWTKCLRDAKPLQN